MKLSHLKSVGYHCLNGSGSLLSINNQLIQLLFIYKIYLIISIIDN